MEPGRSENVGRASLHLEARQEGILLDPANTSKAMAALAADIEQGRLRRTEPVLFVHTGGAPATLVTLHLRCITIQRRWSVIGGIQMSATEKVTLTLPTDLMATVRRMAPARRQSQFIAEAIRAFVKEHERKILRERLIAGYQANASADAALAAEWAVHRRTKPGSDSLPPETERA